jgi:putative oxidoreductase
VISKLLSTNNDVGPAVLRVALGAVIFAHGAQKLLGWFGGSGVSGTMGFLNGFLHVPEPLVYVVIAVEFFGGLGLILGFLTRLGAAASPST